MSPCPHGCGRMLGPLQDCPNPPCLKADNDIDYARERAEEWDPCETT